MTSVAEHEGWPVHRERDSGTGIVADVRADGVPVGLAFPPALLDRRSADLATVLLRTLLAAQSGARDLLEAQAAEEGEGGHW